MMTVKKEEIIKRQSEPVKPGNGKKNMGLDKVIPVRLPTVKWEQMRREAGALRIGPTTLARILILDGLRKMGNGSELFQNQPQGEYDER